MAPINAMPTSYPTTLNEFLYEPVTLKTESSNGNYYPSEPTNLDHYLSNISNVDHYLGHTSSINHNAGESLMDTYVHVLRPDNYKLCTGKNVAAVSRECLRPLISWTTKHPQHWTKEEVLDWIYYVVDHDHLDGSRVRGEAYQSLTGKHICEMTEADFNRIDPCCGTRFYCIFRNMLKNVRFVEPKMEPDTVTLDAFNTKHCSNQLSLTREVCSEAYMAGNSGSREGHGARHLRHSQTNHQHRRRDSSLTKLSDSNGDDLVVYNTDNEMKVDIPSLGTYSISTDFDYPTTSSASERSRSSAYKLTASTIFTAPPPPAQTLIESAFENHLPSSCLLAPMTSSSLSLDRLMETIPASSVSSSPSSSSNTSLSLIFTRLERQQLSTATNRSRASPPESSSVPSSSSSSSSSFSSVVLSMSRNEYPSATSHVTAANGRLDSADSGCITDDSGTHTFMPPLASTPPCSSTMYGVRTAMADSDFVTSLNGRGDEAQNKKMPKKNQSGPAHKSNHLWVFVRDLLKDPKTNPKLLRWEDKENGVFRFIKSEKVAQLWGEKKKNPFMTYEKLSRAMRFCRTAGYFNSVPKNGKFPKKLCFMFGDKASGWLD